MCVCLYEVCLVEGKIENVEVKYNIILFFLLVFPFTQFLFYFSKFHIFRKKKS